MAKPKQPDKDTGTLGLMREAGIPINRKNYIDVAYLGHPPEEWTAELEAELPRQLQDWSQFK